MSIMFTKLLSLVAFAVIPASVLARPSPQALVFNWMYVRRSPPDDAERLFPANFMGD